MTAACLLLHRGCNWQMGGVLVGGAKAWSCFGACVYICERLCLSEHVLVVSSGSSVMHVGCSLISRPIGCSQQSCGVCCACCWVVGRSGHTLGGVCVHGIRIALQPANRVFAAHTHARWLVPHIYVLTSCCFVVVECLNLSPAVLHCPCAACAVP